MPDPLTKPPKITRMTPATINAVTKANSVRKIHGLRLLKITIRSCLACGHLFESAVNKTCGCTKAKNIQDFP